MDNKLILIQAVASLAQILFYLRWKEADGSDRIVLLFLLLYSTLFTGMFTLLLTPTVIYIAKNNFKQ